MGIDGGKLVKGRKRSIVVDTMGYVICVFVHAANIYGCGATHQMEKQEKFYLIKYLKNITLVCCSTPEKGFRRQYLSWRGWSNTPKFVKYLNEKYHCEVEIKLPEEKGCKVIKIRWIVERTFAGLTRNRRLAREYERNTPSSEAMLYIASSRLILKHLSP